MVLSMICLGDELWSIWLDWILMGQFKKGDFCAYPVKLYTFYTNQSIDCLMQKRCNSSALAMELHFLH